MITSYLLAAIGAIGSGTGSVLESQAVRRAGAYGGGNAELGKVAKEPLYWAGVVVDLCGFVAAAAALHHLPLFLVQAVMASSVGVTAIISAFLGRPLRPAGWVWLVAAGTGLVLLAFSADPGRADPFPFGWQLVLPLLSVPIAAFAWWATTLSHRIGGPLLAFAAGIGFSCVAVSARTLPPVGTLFDLVLEPAAWAIAANGVVATIAFAMALQRGSATAESAVMFTTNTVVPSLIGVLVLGDVVRAGYELAAVIGFVLAVVGAIAVTHYANLTTGAASGPVRAPVGGG